MNGGGRAGERNTELKEKGGVRREMQGGRWKREGGVSLISYFDYFLFVSWH